MGVRISDEEILRQIAIFPVIRARLISRHAGDKGRFELTELNGNELRIEGVSSLRVIRLLRQQHYLEVIEERVAFDCELVFHKPVAR